MTPLEERVIATRAQFVDKLETQGFQEHADGTFLGSVAAGGRRHHVAVHLGTGWPFEPPSVKAVDPVVMSWHQSAGILCLYPEEGREGLPWLDPDKFLGTVAAWFEQAEAGWPDDPTDLDLDRYFLRAETPLLVLHGDLQASIGRYVKLRRGLNKTVKAIPLTGPPHRNNPPHRIRRAATGSAIAPTSVRCALPCWVGMGSPICFRSRIVAD